MLSQGVDEQVRGMLWTWTKMEHGNKLGARIDGEPEPQHLLCAAQPCAQFVQLQVREVQMAEEALVQGLRVLACTGQKGWSWWLVESRRIQPFGQRREHHGDPAREGVFRRDKGVLRRAVKVV